jgi:hypothetical protein
MISGAVASWIIAHGTRVVAHKNCQNPSMQAAKNPVIEMQLGT